MTRLPALALTLLSAAGLGAVGLGAGSARANSLSTPSAPAVKVGAPLHSPPARTLAPHTASAYITPAHSAASSSLPARSVTTPPIPPLPPIAAGQGTLLLANRDGSCPEAAPVKLSSRGTYYPQSSGSYRWVRAIFCFTSPGAARASGYPPAR